MNEKKLVVVITENAHHEKTTVGFTIANAALSSGMQVAIFLTTNGVENARDGAADLAHHKPFKPLDELIEGFLGKGGVVWACSPCYQARALKQEENYEKVLVTGAGPLVEWVQNGASTICL